MAGFAMKYQMIKRFAKAAQKTLFLE